MNEIKLILDTLKNPTDVNLLVHPGKNKKKKKQTPTNVLSGL